MYICTYLQIKNMTFLFIKNVMVIKMKNITWEVKHWEKDGKRHLSIKLGMYVRAYVRMTGKTRWRSDYHGKYAREYIANQGDLRDCLTLMMKKEKLEPFGKVPLGCAISVSGPMAHRSDLGNLEKAVEDAANKSIWFDDRWIYQRGPGKKEKAKEDLLQLSVWEI